MNNINDKLNILNNNKLFVDNKIKINKDYQNKYQLLLDKINDINFKLSYFNTVDNNIDSINNKINETNKYIDDKIKSEYNKYFNNVKNDINDQCDTFLNNMKINIQSFINKNLYDIINNNINTINDNYDKIINNLQNKYINQYDNDINKLTDLSINKINDFMNDIKISIDKINNDINFIKNGFKLNNVSCVIINKDDKLFSVKWDINIFMFNNNVLIEFDDKDFKIDIKHIIINFDTHNLIDVSNTYQCIINDKVHIINYLLTDKSLVLDLSKLPYHKYYFKNFLFKYNLF